MIGGHALNHPLQCHHLCWSNTDTDMRKLSSKAKKKFQHLLTGSGRKSDETGADTGGEERPHVVWGDGHDGRYRANAVEGQPYSTDLFLSGHIGSTSTEEGESDRGQRMLDINRTEITQKNPRPPPDAGVVEGSGSSRGGKDTNEEEAGQIYHSSTLAVWKPDSE